MVSFHSYVSLPEGNEGWLGFQKDPKHALLVEGDPGWPRVIQGDPLPFFFGEPG